ncbi:MAG TPA: hypothetical protein VIC51_04100 [Psychromonas sp.]
MTYQDALKDYIEVKDRIQEFYKRYPNGSLQFDFNGTMDIAGQSIIWGRAYAYRDQEDIRPAIGTAWEFLPAKSPFAKGAELMVLETSAWGRAIAALGIAVSKSVASKNEVKAAQERDPWAGPPDDAITALKADLKPVAHYFVDEPTDEPREAVKPSVGSVGPKLASAKQINFLRVLFGKAWQACGYEGKPDDDELVAFVNHNTDDGYTSLSEVTSHAMSKLIDEQSNFKELLQASKNDVQQWKDQAF